MAEGIVARFDAGAEPTAVPTDAEEILATVFDPHRRGELYPLYHALRGVAPVHRTRHRNLRDVWVVSRYDDALELYRNPRAVSDPATAEHFNHGGKGGPFYQMLKQMMLFLESEQHAHVRRIVMKAFTPRAIASVTPITRDIAAGLIRDVAAARQMDIVEQFAYRLPLRVIAYILGVPEEDFATIEAYASDFARGSELAVDETEQSRRADTAAIGFRDYFEHLIARRRHDLRDDVLSALIAAEDDGRHLGFDQLVATCVLLLQAGHETTSDTIGLSLIALFRHPEQMAMLRNDPALTKGAVEELLRFDPTNQMNNRLLLDDIRLGDVHLAAGEQVAILIGAANRDPTHFVEPDVLDLTRPAGLHLAFAFGAYYCVGNSLARAELQVALRSLLDAFPALRPAGDTFRWRDTLRNRGPAELLVEW
ncbi:MAG TPA: cytochrome P450 [Acidimicrobiales bacterium]|nr:cytochrome P450 [Acidimicrobiales bacterium]